MDAQRSQLDNFFLENMAPAWESFVANENKASEEATKSRMSRRRERLKLIIAQEGSISQALARNEVILTQWQANIYEIEHVRFLKTMQDTTDHASFVEATWSRLLRQITREQGILDPHVSRKWRLDMTEGRSRMRKRLMPDIREKTEEYQPKGGHVAPPVRPVPVVTPAIELDVEDSEAEHQSGAEELDFEVVDPDEPATLEEDKNRKVLRSLEPGDTVVDVFNVSRIVGLDAHGLGKSLNSADCRGTLDPRQIEYLYYRSLFPAIRSGNCGCLGCSDGRARSLHPNPRWTRCIDTTCNVGHKGHA
jgi:beige protein homolog 1